MQIRYVIHRGVRRFLERDDATGLPPAVIEKIRNRVTFLHEMGDVKDLRDIPSWTAHPLSGDRKGTWSLAVTRNWRITFGIDPGKKELVDLDSEDYH